MLLKEAAPDIVVLGGDYISFFDRTYIGPVAELLAPLANAPHGSFAVLGNHDDETRSAGGALGARLHRAEGSAHVADDQGRAARSRRHPLLDAHAARDCAAC